MRRIPSQRILAAGLTGLTVLVGCTAVGGGDVTPADGAGTGDDLTGDGLAGDPGTGDPASGDAPVGDPGTGDPGVGDTAGGDALGGDVLGGDVLGGDALGGDALGGDVIGGDALAALCPPPGPYGTAVGATIPALALPDCDGVMHDVHDLCERKAGWFFIFAGY